MIKNLKSFKFTERANKAISRTGWYVLEGKTVNALAGNNTITGTRNTGDNTWSDGIVNDGTIITGNGNNTFIGAGKGKAEGEGIGNYGLIKTGRGNDIISGTCNSDEAADGINNEGKIDVGSGNDRITGAASGYKKLRPQFGSCSGICNEGTINTGSGKDIITGSSPTFEYATGIDNTGTINTGSGKDIVDALKGGFNGVDSDDFDKLTGRTYLGAGNDTLKGFGTGRFYGGTGKDKILFGQGKYKIRGSTIVSGAVTMNVNEFEQIGGANGGLFTFKNGTLKVNAAGVGTFV